MKQEMWDQRSIQDQKGKIVLITGSSSGLGLESARVLANKNAEVIIAIRNLKKGKIAEEKIKSGNPNAITTVMSLDLADLSSVKIFTEEFKKNYSQLDLLINNAGVMAPPYSKTKDGFELQFGTNHLGHFALTGLLYNILKNTPNSRIVNLASNAHKMGNMNLRDLNWETRRYSAWKAYGDSKIANLYFTYELAKKLKNSNSDIIAVAAHPGWTQTELQRYSGAFEFFGKFWAQNPDMGALPTLYAATAEDVKNGDYFGPSGWQEWRGYPKKVESNKLSHNENIASQLWDISEKMTGIKFNL